MHQYCVSKKNCMIRDSELQIHLKVKEVLICLYASVNRDYPTPSGRMTWNYDSKQLAESLWSMPRILGLYLKRNTINHPSGLRYWGVPTVISLVDTLDSYMNTFYSTTKLITVLMFLYMYPFSVPSVLCHGMDKWHIYYTILFTFICNFWRTF